MVWDTLLDSIPIIHTVSLTEGMRVYAGSGFPDRAHSQLVETTPPVGSSSADHVGPEDPEDHVRLLYQKDKQHIERNLLYAEKQSTHQDNSCWLLNK